MKDDPHAKKKMESRPITFYETFDDEIVQIDEREHEQEVLRGPRISHPPIPIIPGFFTLTDAFEKQRMRLEEELRERMAREDEAALAAKEKIAESDPLIQPIWEGEGRSAAPPEGSLGDYMQLKVGQVMKNLAECVLEEGVLASFAREHPEHQTSEKTSPKKAPKKKPQDATPKRPSTAHAPKRSLARDEKGRFISTKKKKEKEA
ncbi:hypothetical protein ABB02_00615 [Clostridiaceae bacterium JG1575]|nr:hypothetical protein ABB02_00615 [Clostridiaceae bacterium JG1575]